MSLHAAVPALAAAALFGASVPLAKLLVGSVPPLLLAGLLYLGSGLGLGGVLAWRRLRRPGASKSEAFLQIPRSDLPWLAGTVAAGGMLGPALLMLGLQQVGGAAASLLLNLEAVFTAAIAWLVFREHTDRRIVLAMAAIVAGALLLSWQPGAMAMSLGALLVVGACLAWAIDNNLTRRISTSDAMLLACLKGMAAGVCNTALAFAGGAEMPAASSVGASFLVGFLGYGLSLTLFVQSLRSLGTARTGAYFSVAPLFGVVVAFVLWPEPPGAAFWVAAALMAIGVWLHVRERHVHEHHHEPLEHSHAHRHDAHHQHRHDFDWDGSEPHVHPHAHAAMRHRHAHYPDVHHRHRHSRR